jgi:malonate-semialdehyde dehydrogenase (acetylating)/methylmalonate-semialdehyde dehydrogenase
MTEAATTPTGSGHRIDDRAARPAIETEGRVLRNYVGGRWREAQAEETLDTRNPATGELLARVPLSGAGEVDDAVSAAREAFAAWRATSPLVRARALFALRDALVAERDELARLVTIDMGKTLDDARGEVGRGIESVETACGGPSLLKGEGLEGVARGVDVELVRQPVGVVAAITPFNFPAMIPLWFLPFALAAGNTFVLKPSERDPLASERIVELVDAIDGIPPGVVNLVHGGREAVDGLLDHPSVDAVSFVGSAATAGHVYRRAAEHGKRVQALGGAKNAMVVMPDADPEAMPAGVAASAFGAAGQRCLAGSVAVLVGSEAEQDRARELIVSAARELRNGPGLDPETDVCPLIGPEARERLEGEIDRAVRDGAELVLDGRTGGGEAGTELGATVIDRAEPGTRLLDEELFGPVLALTRVPDLDAALERVNASRYGNAAVIFTSSGAAARSFRFGVEAGMVGVNVGVAAPVAWFPFAGWKGSFSGDLHANGADAIRFYTRAKVVTSRWT